MTILLESPRIQTLAYKEARSSLAYSRIPALDGLRGIAIFLVLVWHYFSIVIVDPGTIGSYAIASLRLTWSGVDLFFVLSGFLIGGILIDNCKAKNYFNVFYIRRVFRIIPLYTTMILLFLFTAHIVDYEWLFGKSIPLWSYTTFSQNFLMVVHNTFGSNWFGITWSLAVEEQFYLVLPFVIWYLDNKRLPWFLIGCIISAPLLRVAFSLSHPHGAFAAYVLMPCRADALLLGTLCAWLVRNTPQTLARNTSVLYVLFVILLLGTALIAIRGNPLFSVGWAELNYTWLALLYACLLLIVVTSTHGAIKSIVTNIIFRKLGVIAYGVYLFHQGVNGLSHWAFSKQDTNIHNMNDLLVTIFALVLTLLLASVSWSYFEKPLIEKGHRFRYFR